MMCRNVAWFLILAATTASLGAEPASEWTPRVLRSDVSVGTIQEATVSLRANGEVPRLRLMVSGRLSDLIDVEPALIGPLSEGESADVTLVVDAPFGMRGGRAAGVITVSPLMSPRAQTGQGLGGEPNAFVPLPIVLRVDRPNGGTVKGDSTSVEFTAPSDWYVTESAQGPAKYEIYSPGSAEELDAGSVMTPADVTLSLIDNPDGLDVASFAHSYDDGWYASYAESESRLIDGHDAYLVSDALASGLRHFPPWAAFVDVSGDILVVTGEDIDSGTWETILAGLRLQ